MLNNVDTICDFQESQLYKHMKFQEVENPYTEEMKKELLEGFRNAEEFAYMKEYEPWKKLLSGNQNCHFSQNGCISMKKDV